MAKDNNHNKNINVNNEDYEVFNMNNVEPLNAPDCNHHFVQDDDEIGDTRAWVCKHCLRGVFIQKGAVIINS